MSRRIWHLRRWQPDLLHEAIVEQLGSSMQLRDEHVFVDNPPRRTPLACFLHLPLDLRLCLVLLVHADRTNQRVVLDTPDSVRQGAGTSSLVHGLTTRAKTQHQTWPPTTATALCGTRASASGPAGAERAAAHSRSARLARHRSWIHCRWTGGRAGGWWRWSGWSWTASASRSSPAISRARPPWATASPAPPPRSTESRPTLTTGSAKSRPRSWNRAGSRPRSWNRVGSPRPQRRPAPAQPSR
eukprot:3096194-Rhodomonas_salina.2